MRFKLVYRPNGQNDAHAPKTRRLERASILYLGQINNSLFRLMCSFIYLCTRERERQRQRQTETETDRDRDRATDRQSDKQRERDRDRDRQRETERDRVRERERANHWHRSVNKSVQMLWTASPDTTLCG